jgi:hypothetical protein
VLKTVGSEILRRREHLADLNLMGDNFKVNFFIACDGLDSAQQAQNGVQSQALLNTTINLPGTSTFLKQNTSEKFKLRIGVYCYLSCVTAGPSLILRVNNNNNNNNNNVYIEILRP